MKYASKVKMNRRMNPKDTKMNASKLNPKNKLNAKDKLKSLRFVEAYAYMVDKRIIVWNFCFIITCLKLLLDFSLLE